MRVGSIAAAAAVVVIAGAYLSGYVPQRRARTAAEAHARALQEQLTGAEARVRTGELLGQALTLKEVAERRNYGAALELSSAFFDAVRTEAMRMTDPGLRDSLNDVLASRDMVTAALAKSDPTVTETLHEIELRLRRTLKFSLPPES